MYTYAGAHGATDVTGFGLLGHAQNLASAQKAAVSFKIHTLPGMHIHVDVLTVYIYLYDDFKGITSSV